MTYKWRGVSAKTQNKLLFFSPRDFLKADFSFVYRLSQITIFKQ
jgi:hypothetical protein